MEMPATRRRSGKNAFYYLILLLAGGSLCLGLYSGILLLRIRSTAANPPQPYVATTSDLDAEKQAQRRKLAELLDKDEESSPVLPPVASIGPQPDPMQDKPSGKKLEPRNKTEPETRSSPPENRPGRPAMPPAAKVLPPEFPAAYADNALLEIKRIQIKMERLADRMAGAANADKLLFGYLGDEIAAMHVQMRHVGSQVAVAEYAIKQLQELSLVSLLNMLSAVVGALQGLVILYEFVRNKWRPD